MRYKELKIIQELKLENGFKIIVYEGCCLDETTEPKDFENIVCFVSAAPTTLY